MSEKIVDEVCMTCGHSMSQHFCSVLGKVRCLHSRTGTNRMTGEVWTRECSCLDYQLADPYQKACHD